MLENLKNYEDKRKEFMKPKNDIIFQELFTRGKESITKAMLEDILKIKIHKLDLDKTKDLLNDNAKEKNGRLDLRAVINDNIECDIEIQLSTHERLIERFLYYWAKMYSASLEIGDDYVALRKTISIIIIDDNIERLNGIDKAHTKWQLREEKYKEMILTNFCELHIIELNKAVREYKNNKQDGLLQWMMFLDDPENVEVAKIMEENKDIKKANEEWEKLRRDEMLMRKALNEKIARLDEKQRLNDALKNAKLETAKKMLEKGIDIETIIEITELSREQILNNKKQ